MASPYTSPERHAGDGPHDGARGAGGGRPRVAAPCETHEALIFNKLKKYDFRTKIELTEITNWSISY